MPKVEVNGAETYYETHGQGQPFLFFSETACDGEIWKLFQVPEFSKDHMVIVHDYRGTGRSSKPSIDYTTRMFCDDAIAVLGQLKVKDAIVLGHSMGGRVAQLVALEYPQRVKKLILASSGASFPGPPGLPQRNLSELSWFRKRSRQTLHGRWRLLLHSALSAKSALTASSSVLSERDGIGISSSCYSSKQYPA